MHSGTEQRLRRVAALRMPVVAYRKLRDRVYDAWWNVNTCRPPAVDTTDAGRFSDGTRYEPIWYPLLERYVDALAPAPDDVVFDVGSGLGRVLMAFARRGVARCVGIEISAELAAIAERNALLLRRPLGRTGPSTRIETRVEDASTADYSGGTIYFMSNPFGPRTLAAVMDGIARSIAADPRPVRIAYCTPRHEQILHGLPWLAPRGTVHYHFHRSSISYWHHDPSIHPAPVVGDAPIARIGVSDEPEVVRARAA